MADWGRFAFVFLWVLGIGGVVGSMRSERFAESLVVRPLADGRVLGHFQFENELGSGHGRHHKLFPKAIFQIVQAFHIQEMSLSFTQGRWDHRLWGSADVKPGGVELWAHFQPSNHNIDTLWRNLTHTLSGLFCASINFLEDPATVSNWRTGDTALMNPVRQGSLPREAVCTENLTPWLKLLPCRDKAGLSTLLERPRIHNANYYSLQVHVKSSNASLTLSQTLSVVLKPSDASRSWSLSSLFGRPLVGSCPLASASHVHLELEANLVEALKRANGDTDVTSNEFFSLNLASEGVLSGEASVLVSYDVEKWSPLDVGMSWRMVLGWLPRQGPFRATQFLTGRGNGGGAIVSVVNANGGCPDDHGLVDVTMFQIVPWYVRLYMHTMQVVVDGEQVKKGVRLKMSPADDRKSPSVVEVGVTVPRNTSVVVFSVEFDKGYLRIDEHPPDANRGFDLPAALFSFSSSGLDSGVQIYSDNLLVLLATPDFSMPYNVITFTMTALALYFGSLLNSLRLRSVTDVEVQQPASRISIKLKELFFARFRGREKVKTL